MPSRERGRHVSPGFPLLKRPFGAGGVVDLGRFVLVWSSLTPRGVGHRLNGKPVDRISRAVRVGLTLAMLVASVTPAGAVEFVPPRKAAQLQPRPSTQVVRKVDPCADRGDNQVSATWREGQSQQTVHVERTWRTRFQQSQDAGRATASAASGMTTNRSAVAAAGTTWTSRRDAKPLASGVRTVSESSPSSAVRPAAMVEGAGPGVATAVFRDVAIPKVQLTAHQTAANPFDDPFGEGREPLPVAVPSVSLQPPATNRDAELSPAPESRSSDGQMSDDELPEAPRFDSDSDPSIVLPQDGPLGRSAPDAGRDADDAPAPPTDSTPGYDEGEAPSPMPSSGEWEPLTEPKETCKRTYNGRDCCTEDDLCAAHRKRVNEVRIDMISLDITPRMTVTQLDSPVGQSPQEYKQELSDELRKAPARIWRNRQGEQVADGRMVNFQLGRVEIQTEREVVKVAFADLSDDDMCFVTAWWNIPTECVIADGPLKSRAWMPTTLAWRASALCHKPLYFEDVRLERYGHSSGVMQPFYSGAHFFVNIAALPYNMALYPPYECRYPLGYYRPGVCAPWLVPPVPLSPRGALSATGFYLGLGYLIP